VNRVVPLVALLLAAPATVLGAEPAPAVTARAIAIAEDQRRFEPVLAAALDHRDPALRLRATRAVGRLQDSTTVPALVARLTDGEVRVRREAAFALGQVGHRSAREPLAAALGDRDPVVRLHALEALGKLLDPRATAVVTARLADRDPALRQAAAVALWRLADTTACDALLARLTESDAAVRWRVVYALEKLPLPARIGPAVAPLLADRDALVRAHAARTLGRVRARAQAGALLQALQDPDAPTVVNAIRALQLLADSSRSSAATALARLLALHRDPQVRVTAATALADGFAWAGATPPEAAQAQAALNDAVADRDAATRGAAARALLVRNGLQSWPGVEPLMADSVVYTRTAVIDGLRGLTERELRQVPAQVARALAPSLAAGRPLLERMTALDAWAALAVRSGHAAFRERLPDLRAGLSDREVLIVAATASALAEAGDSASVPALATVYAARAADADPDARLAVRDALRSLAGRAFADSLERAHPAPVAATDPPAGFEHAPTERGARLHTSAGVIEWAFTAAEAPQTVRNFVTLARRGYFDGLRVHRVVPDFVIQDGDPTGTGWGGPGYAIRCEYHPLRYEAGMVGMALSGKDTGGSQWFITLSPQPHLDGRFTIFARVTRGLEVARRIVQGDAVHRVEILR
jgi:cyclophilin family peptidyl-prolyl cis-trans isomerase/HEAT repeat protein